jgi:hypothetical protein
MEIFFISFLVFLISCAGLAAGQWFGRDPIRGGCRPDNDPRTCARKDACNGLCSIRDVKTKKRGA